MIIYQTLVSSSVILPSSSSSNGLSLHIFQSSSEYYFPSFPIISAIFYSLDPKFEWYIILLSWSWYYNALSLFWDYQLFVIHIACCYASSIFQMLILIASSIVFILPKWCHCTTLSHQDIWSYWLSLCFFYLLWLPSMSMIIWGYWMFIINLVILNVIVFQSNECIWPVFMAILRSNPFLIDLTLFARIVRYLQRPSSWCIHP